MEEIQQTNQVEEISEASAFEQPNERREETDVDIESFVNEKLSSKVEVDEDGYQRRIFEYNDITFCFKGLNELPVYPTLKNSRTVIIGEESKVLPVNCPKEYAEYKNKLNSSESNSELQEHYVVNKTLLGVLNLASKLGARDESVNQLVNEVSTGIYSEKALYLLDALVACNFLEKDDLVEKPRIAAEVVVLLSLLGDKQAQSVVLGKFEKFCKRFKTQENLEQRVQTELESQPLKDSCVVHATRYEPEESKDGLSVKTTFDATNGNVLRHTIHTSLSRKVGSHLYGSWEDVGYIIISPLEEMIKENGVPYSLRSDDTYWERNPGEKLSFPKSTLVAPGGKEVENLIEYVEEENKVKYKSEDIDIKDFQNLVTIMEDEDEKAREERYRSRFGGNLRPLIEHKKYFLGVSLRDSFQEVYSQIDWNQWGNPELGTLCVDKLGTNNQEEKKYNGMAQLLLSDTGGNIKERITSFIKTDLIGAIKSEVEDKDLAIDKLSNLLTNNVKNKILSKIVDLAVRKAFLERGFEYDNSNDGSFSSDQADSFAKRVGISTHQHWQSVPYLLTGWYESSVANISMFDSNDNFILDKHHKLVENIAKLVPQMSVKALRVMYAAGVLSSRY